MSVRSDAALLRRFRAGDETAFAALHARYADAIRNYAAYMLRGSAHDPEDAAQDVFLRAYQALRRDDREIDVRPWLFRVAHNRCIDVLRRPLTDDLDAEETASEGATADPANAIEQRETMRALLKDIGALTDGQRSALLLRELGGLSHEAVGEALGISTTSSRMLVHRARVALTDAAEARDTTCRDVRDRLVAASDAGKLRLARRDRRHLAGCVECRAFRRAHAGVERELSLLVPFAGGGSGLAALLKVFGGGGAAAGGGGAVAASTTAGGGGLAAKLTVGACCALLAGGGAAVGVKEATEQDHHQRPRTAERRARVRPRAVAAAPAAAAAAAKPVTTQSAAAPARAKPTTTARTTTTTATPPAQQPVSDSPTARPPAHEDPRTSVDLADLSGDPDPDPAPPARTAPRRTTTIDLADFGG
ncbi:RNA polymerase sigma factor [Conexibacter woesei]|uniref:RNA polymerase sigma factor n=1 Tax=Conexibacter woesei TaxID=191495 RepID=UPI0003F901F5|nr:sigma-70 family RNA polymerase sigma factor [Conexibacter woesei]